MAKKKPRGRKSPTEHSALQRGLGVSLAGVKAGTAIAWGDLRRRLGSDSPEHERSALLRREAEQFVVELGRLKGSYVKIGQLLSEFGEHLLPEELTEALQMLNSETEPLPWESVQQAVQVAIRGHETRVEIEEHAFAAASLAQVHRATWRAPRRRAQTICLKVLYPGLLDTIDADFNHVVRMLQFGRFLPAGRQFNSWLEAMREQLRLETDYRHELQMMQSVATLVTQLCETSPALEPGRLALPLPIEQFCTDKVMAMEYVVGYRVGDSFVQQLSQRRRNALAKAMLELFFAEVYSWGVIQTDPNFGNYLIKPSQQLRGDGAEPDQLVLLDFGAVRRPSEEFIEHLRAAIYHGLFGETRALEQALIGMGCLREDSGASARKTFCDFCRAILEPLRPAEQLPSEYLNASGQYQWAHSELIKRVGKLGAAASLNHQFSLPAVEFTLVARKLIGVFTFLAVLGAEFNGHDIAWRYTRAWQKTAG